ncbi:hypothetical protein [Maribacter sp. 2304DJ31-5]|uniref:hypothetical protein n=1 Tax=Maribacter sp. 2304DJ31-5 TaxID=3386273 RepID=UPI0039BD39A8
MKKCLLMFAFLLIVLFIAVVMGRPRTNYVEDEMVMETLGATDLLTTNENN